MKVKNYLMMSLIALCAASCSDDDEVVTPENLAKAVAGTYSGYTSGTFQYSPDPLITNGEKINITANEDGTFDLVFQSAQWGTSSVENATVEKDTDGDYTLSGTGTSQMGMGATTNEYDCTLTGTISADKQEAEIVVKVPAVMGGLTITFHLGDAPVNLYLAGTYNGYTSAQFAYSPDPMVTDEESVAISANEDGTLSVVLTSSAWGTSTIASATAELNQDGTAYTLDGTGTSLMSMSGPAKEYTCTLSGTISADKENAELAFTLNIMGGTTITFHTGEAPADDSAE